MGLPIPLSNPVARMGNNMDPLLGLRNMRCNISDDAIIYDSSLVVQKYMILVLLKMKYQW